MNATTSNHRTIFESRFLRAVVVTLLSGVLILVIGNSRTVMSLRCAACLHTPMGPSLQFSRTLRRRRETSAAIAAAEMSVQTDIASGGFAPGTNEERRQFKLDNRCNVVIRLPLESRVKALNVPELSASANNKATERLSLRC